MTLSVSRVSKRILALLLALAALFGMAALAWTLRCERACGGALTEAEARLAGEDLLGALRTLDAADARCDCGSFTRGDAPPEYSLAVLCIRRLQAAGREDELRALLSSARGPILTDLREP